VAPIKVRVFLVVLALVSIVLLWIVFHRLHIRKDHSKITTGYDNVALGSAAVVEGITTGYDNVALGSAAVVEGEYDFCLGRDAGKNITTASRCILLGDGAGEDITTEDLIFSITTEYGEWRTKMSPSEWTVIRGVLIRALEEKKP